ncbi:prolyl oligopeptidase family serine peptidase [Tahibacter caeni]|uniref:prolyl oligopeptidase family serine peptidase n=1 Tax=Tahibacter caeni TaxID=1453545 RepID=UPI002148DF50|nr:prolyl oligopeptidase family serine peptidase [Tahibacter caeni]
MNPNPRHLIRCLGLFVLAAAASAGIASAADAPPPARIADVEDRYFDDTVVDPYRWMEQPSAELDTWYRAQNAYTRRWYERDAAQHRRWFDRIRALQTATANLRFVTRTGDQYFFLETPTDGGDVRLMQRAVAGGEKRLLLQPAALGESARRRSLDFISVSPDGRHVAVAVGEGGSENWSLRFVDVRSGKLLADTLPRLSAPVPRWSADGKGVYYAQLQKLPPGAPETRKHENNRVFFHALGAAAGKDKAVFGPGVDPAVEIDGKISFTDAAESADGRWLVGSVNRGTDGHVALWLRDLRSKKPAWRRIADPADAITAVALHADQVYVISEKDSPNGRVLRFGAERGSLADAKEWYAPAGVILGSGNGWLADAADALYVVGTRNGSADVAALSYDEAGKSRALPLGVLGEMIEFSADPNLPGVTYALQAPTLSPRVFRYEPGQAPVDTGLRAADPADFSAIATTRVEIASGGVQVPLTITARKDLPRDGKNPVLLVTYGSYGALSPMWFSAPDLAWYERGGVLAFAHVRGGGEKGAAWHEAGRGTRKQHAVDDLVAAARWLIAEGYTSPDHLAIAGKSAGGIVMSAALAQQPQLFRAVMFRVGVTDLLRIEQTAGGPANVVEYGSVKNPEEYRALRAISGYANLRRGTAYPAVLLEAGYNDPRVPAWQLGKMAARLQASTSSRRPVLLRVDFDAGHGLGSSPLQVAELKADEYAFLARELGLDAEEPEGD